MTEQGDTQSLSKKIRKLEQTIDAQKKEIKDLKDEARLFDILKDNTSDLIHSVTPEGHFLFVNRAWQEALGYTEQDLRSLKLMDIVDPDCLGKCEVIFQDLIAGQKVDRNDTVFIAKNGTKISVEGRCSTRFVDGKPVAMIGVFRNRNDSEINAKALVESEERYRDLFENTSDLCQLVDPSGRILYVNRAWRETFGYSEEEIGNLSIFQLISSDCQNHCEQTFQKVISEPKLVYIDSVFMAKDGRRISIEGNAICKFVDGKPVRTQCIFRDVTQKKRMEEELHKAQKIESLGILAGGIAHDFNNLLTAILGNVSLARMHIGNREKVTTYLENTERASLRAKSLTQQLLTFSKGGAPIKRATTISDLIRDSSAFILRGSKVNCVYDFASDLWPVEVDEGQLSQVTQNLVINASQAMAMGGTLTIRGRNRILEEGTVPSLPAGKYIELQVEDEGEGIPEEHLAKIFDPYFTSKPSGSGLGLAISYSIIKNHDGIIQVRSKAGEGTVFTIYLPAVTETVRLCSPAEDKEGPHEIRARVLVMDDEEVVRDISMEILEFLGCETEVAADGHEAITRYLKAKEENRPFDVLIMDLTIPGSMGGVETFERLRILDPNVKALVSSGYANDPVMANFQDYGFSGVVPKPFKVEELNKALSAVIPPIKL